MAHYQKIRKDAGKLTCTVFGILSDSDRWIFYRLDENSKVWRSIDYFFRRDKSDIWTFVDHIIDTSERLLPTSTPMNSEADLLQKEPSFRKYVDRFITVKDKDLDDEDLEDLSSRISLLFNEYT